jgi:formylglycine-generating enzyme required for sulfatase activity
MIAIAGGEFWMGSDDHYPEEAPARRVRVDPFRIDPKPVTNREFRRFVKETGYVTLAEIAPSAADYPGADPALLVAGSSVFIPPARPVPLNDPSTWWRFVPGASWRQPLGNGRGLEGLLDHPVVQISYADAQAYAEWAGKRLLTEAEWEFAARGELDRQAFAWGNVLEPDGRPLANYWHGRFPYENRLTDGFARTSPVASFPSNAHGLFDMIGNVWEWTADWYGQQTAPIKACCVRPNPRGIGEAESRARPDDRYGRKVLKGGSHLCAPNYCQRYRPAARLAHSIDSPTSHIGFRCAAAVEDGLGGSL